MLPGVGRAASQTTVSPLPTTSNRGLSLRTVPWLEGKRPSTPWPSHDLARPGDRVPNGKGHPAIGAHPTTGSPFPGHIGRHPPGGPGETKATAQTNQPQTTKPQGNAETVATTGNQRRHAAGIALWPDTLVSHISSELPADRPPHPGGQRSGARRPTGPEGSEQKSQHLDRHLKLTTF